MIRIVYCPVWLVHCVEDWSFSAVLLVAQDGISGWELLTVAQSLPTKTLLVTFLGGRCAKLTKRTFSESSLTVRWIKFNIIKPYLRVCYQNFRFYNTNLSVYSSFFIKLSFFIVSYSTEICLQSIYLLIWEHSCAILARIFWVLAWDRKISRYLGIVFRLSLNLLFLVLL